MSGVFISYSRVDRDLAAQVTGALRRLGVEVWWDEDMPGVDWQDELEREINALAAVVVIWTPASVASRNVRDEARLGKHMEKLVNVLAGVASPPFPYDAINGLPLNGWTDRAPHSGWQRLVATIEGHLVTAGAMQAGALKQTLAAREAAMGSAERALAGAEDTYQQAQTRHGEAQAAREAAAAAFTKAEAQLASVVAMSASPGLLHAAHAELERAEQGGDAAEAERRAAAERLATAARELTAARAALAQLLEPAGTAPAPKPAPAPPPPRIADPPPPSPQAPDPEPAAAVVEPAPAEVAWQPRGPRVEPKTSWARPLVFAGAAAAVLLVALVVGLLPRPSGPAAPSEAPPAAAPPTAAEPQAGPAAPIAAPKPTTAAQSKPPLLVAAPDKPATASTAPPKPSAGGEPRWLRRPTGEDLAQYYPDRASRMSVSGKAVITCSVAASGAMQDCSVVSEDPPDQEFGSAALKLSKLFRMSPASAAATPRVNIPIVFQLPKDE